MIVGVENVPFTCCCLSIHAALVARVDDSCRAASDFVAVIVAGKTDVDFVVVLVAAVAVVFRQERLVGVFVHIAVETRVVKPQVLAPRIGRRIFVALVGIVVGGGVSERLYVCRHLFQRHVRSALVDRESLVAFTVQNGVTVAVVAVDSCRVFEQFSAVGRLIACINRHS